MPGQPTSLSVRVSISLSNTTSTGFSEPSQGRPGLDACVIGWVYPQTWSPLFDKFELFIA